MHVISINDKKEPGFEREQEGEGFMGRKGRNGVVILTQKEKVCVGRRPTKIQSGK